MRHRLATALLPAWLVLAGVTFMWPTELEMAMDRIRSSFMPVTFQDIQLLKRSGSPEAVELLFDLLSRSDEVTVLNAARALADLTRESWMEPRLKDGRILEDVLVGWLDLPDADMRRTACEMLGQVGATDQTDRVAMMITDADLDVRAMCVRTLLLLYSGARDLSPVKNMSVQMLSDPYHEVRINAIAGLAQLGVAETFVSFLPLLESDNPSMRSRALDAVTAIDPKQAFPFAEKALGDSEHEVRVAGVTALGRIGDPAAVEVLEPLISDQVLGRHVIEALGRIPDHASFELLIELLSVPGLRDAALIAISVHQKPSVQAVEKGLLGSWDKEELRMLVKVAFLHPDPSYLPGLKRVLGMAPERKLDVIEALSGIHEPDSLHLVLSLVSDLTPKVQTTALSAAGKILEDTGLDPAAADVLVDALCYEDPAVRQEALSLVRRWRIHEAAVFLVPLLDSRHESEAVEAAATLLELDETVGVPVLVGALSSTSRDLVLEAASVLADRRPARALDPLVELLEREVESDREDPDRGLRFELLGLLMRDAPSPEATALVRDLLSSKDLKLAALGARAALVSSHPDLVPALVDMQDGKRVALRRAIAPYLWHLDVPGAGGMIEAALGDVDPMTRALAVLSLELTDQIPDSGKVPLLLSALSDGDEFVRINAAAALSGFADLLEEHREALCAAYDRDLTQVEMQSALVLLSRAGAPCLEERVDRLLFHPSSATMGAVVEAIRTGTLTHGVTTTDGIRMGLGVCARGTYHLLSATCQSLLDGTAAEGCPSWTTAVVLGPGKTVHAWPETILPGVHRPEMQTSIEGRHPVFAIDRALTIHVTVLEDGLVSGLPPPACGGYRAEGVLRY